MVIQIRIATESYPVDDFVDIVRITSENPEQTVHSWADVPTCPSQLSHGCVFVYAGFSNGLLGQSPLAGYREIVAMDIRAFRKHP